MFHSVQEEGRNNNRLKKIMQITSNTEDVNPNKKAANSKTILISSYERLVSVV